jgi:hypothetical protein
MREYRIIVEFHDDVIEMDVERARDAIKALPEVYDASIEEVDA